MSLSTHSRTIVKPEYEISSNDLHEIIELIRDCYESSAHVENLEKQSPSFRIYEKSDTGIYAHIAIEYRNIRIENETYKILGLSNVCVSQEYRKKGIASYLIQKCKDLLNTSNASLLVLIAPTQQVYLKNGFVPVRSNLKWTFIQNNNTMGVLERDLGDDFMLYSPDRKIMKIIRSLNRNSASVNIDLLGHIF